MSLGLGQSFVIVLKLKEKAALAQPDWVCNSCGNKHGYWFQGDEYTGPSIHAATYHEGRCGVCGKTAPVTEARDYGYLMEAWLDEEFVEKVVV